MSDSNSHDAFYDGYQHPDDALRCVDIGTFLKMELPAREMILAPVFPTQGLVMVYAPRGQGKTFFGLGLAHAVAGGGTFLRWQAPKPRGVVYVDGEMATPQMQERGRLILNGAEFPLLDLHNFRMINGDMQGDAQLDICAREGQAMIEEHLHDADVLVLDNLACLMRSGGENEGDSWLPVQDWLLRLRRRRKSVLIVHHAGKGGQQRGTSRREDILDTVIALRRPSDYEPNQGARFEVHLEKARGLYGEAALPFEAQLLTANDGVRWVVKPMDDVEREKVIALTLQNLTITEIAEETGMSKSKVGRLRKAAEAAGLLKKPED